MRFLLPALILFTFSFSARAFIFIEPQIGYSSGTFKLLATNEIDPTAILGKNYSANGLSYGGKAGLEFSFVQLAFDYVHTDAKVDGETDKLDEFGYLLGLRFGWFRIYGGSISNAKEEDTEGSGIKGGITFYAWENVALNFEYKSIYYDDYLIDGTNISLTYNAFGVYLAFPFSI